MNTSNSGVEYANILADITNGKNFEAHYKTVTERINGLNRSIDSKRSRQEDCCWIVTVCYNYYRLQQLIKREILKLKSPF